MRCSLLYYIILYSYFSLRYFIVPILCQYIRLLLYLHLSLSIYIYTQIICVHIHIYTHKFTYIYIYIYIYTYTYTYIVLPRASEGSDHRDGHAVPGGADQGHNNNY